MRPAANDEDTPLVLVDALEEEQRQQQVGQEVDLPRHFVAIVAEDLHHRRISQSPN